MTQELKDKWVAALRSGKYKQTSGVLKRMESGACSYCCLGVLATLAGEEFEPFSDDDFTGDFLLVRHPGSAPGYLPADLLDTTVGIHLGNMNDHGKTFRQIASYIEKNVEATS